MWVNATYGAAYNNDVLRCKTAKLAGAAFDIAHWTLASKYTDDTAVTTFINGAYATFVTSIQSQVDGKAQSWYQATDPSTAWTTTAEKNKHIGDLWCNTSSSTVAGIDAGCSGVWNGTAWAAIDVPDAVYDKIDGKSSIYTTMPDNPETGDLLIPTTTFTSGGVTFTAGHAYKYTENGAWVEMAYTDDTAVNALAAKLNDDNTFTIIEKRAVRENLKEICDTEGMPANFITIESEELVVGASDWTEETSGTYVGWKKSTMHDNSSAAVVRITFELEYDGDFSLKIASAAETSFDYTFAGKIDEDDICDSGGNVDSTKIQASTAGKQNTVITVNYTGVTAGNHTIEIGFRKDSSVATQPDTGYYLISEAWQIKAAGTLKTAYDKCVSAGKSAQASALAQAACGVFSYLINTGRIFASEDTTVVGATFRAAVISYFAAWYNALLAASESVGRSDLDYLAKLFADGSTTVAGGAIISNLVGVTDTTTPTKVVAGLNGSSKSDFVDTTHGRLMLFAGANGAGNAKTAKYRVYEDGHTYQGDTEIEGKITSTSGQIGGFTISDSGLTNGTSEDDCQMDLSRYLLRFKDNDIGTNNGKGAISIGANVLPSTLGGAAGCFMIELDNDDTYNRGLQNFGAYIDVTGDYCENFAVYAANGIYGGLRPMTKCLTSGATLNKMWYHIMLFNTSSITLTLPDNPEVGQTFEIMRVNGGPFVLSGNGKTVWAIHDGSSGSSITISGSTRECWRVVYCNSKWYIFPYHN